MAPLLSFAGEPSLGRGLAGVQCFGDQIQPSVPKSHFLGLENGIKVNSIAVKGKGVQVVKPYAWQVLNDFAVVAVIFSYYYYQVSFYWLNKVCPIHYFVQN